MKRNKFRQYSLFYCILLPVLIGDQLTKFFADMWLVGRTVTIWPKYIFLSYSQNSGAAWSLFQGNALLLGFIGILVLAIMFFSRKHLNIKRCPNQVAYGMICAGIAGNVIDRLSYGHVIDFIDIRLGNFCWPTFNIADAAICCGFLCIFYLLFSENRRKLKAMFY
ncbi:MAG: signal peptidase II [Puniceicoccales bacterium]|jgi:signal peptidase II|nr:signal peptidase II [Puniceicoccales bacterium]